MHWFRGIHPTRLRWTQLRQTKAAIGAMLQLRPGLDNLGVRLWVRVAASTSMVDKDDMVWAKENEIHHELVVWDMCYFSIYWEE